jgi:hypothetical protein
MGSTFFLVGNDSEKLVYESAIFRGRNRKKKRNLLQKGISKPSEFCFLQSLMFVSFSMSSMLI